MTTAALTQVTKRLKFLVAFRPGLISPTLAAQMAATFQRVSGGRLLLNVVVGGDEVEQRRFGDFLSQGRPLRPRRRLPRRSCAARGRASRSTSTGEHITVEDAQVPDAPQWPRIYFGGSSPAALKVAARHADVVPDLGRAAGRRWPRSSTACASWRTPRAASCGYGIRLHAITRETSEEAWAAADKLLAELDPAQIERAQANLRAVLLGGPAADARAARAARTDGLEIYPNLWAGVGLVRGGAGTALVGSYEEVADRIAEYHDLGLDEFILSRLSAPRGGLPRRRGRPPDPARARAAAGARGGAGLAVSAARGRRRPRRRRAARPPRRTRGRSRRTCAGCRS